MAALFRLFRPQRLPVKLQENTIRYYSAATSSVEALKYSIATPKDAEDITKMVVDGFDKTEPLGVALGMTKEDTISYIPFFVNKYLKEPVSVVVKNADDEMVAVQLCSIESRHQHQSDDLYTKLKPTAKALRVFEFLVHMENDIWSLVPPDVNHILKLQITYVRPDYTGRGIAKQMSSMRMDTARKLGCQGISTTSTNAITQHLRLKEGYQPLKTVMYEDWKDNEGNVIFRMKDASDRAILTFKRF